MSDQPSNAGELILNRTASDTVRVEVLYESETFWLNQRQTGELFGVDVRAIKKRIRKVFAINEVADEATIGKVRIVQREGRREGKS